MYVFEFGAKFGCVCAFNGYFSWCVGVVSGAYLMFNFALVCCSSLRSPVICSCCCVCVCSSSSMVLCAVCNEVCSSSSFVILSRCSSCVWLSLYCCVVRA